MVCMTMKRGAATVLLALLPALAAAQGARPAGTAQSSAKASTPLQTAESPEMGLRLQIPENWEWRDRPDSDSFGRSMILNCMPETPGMMPCAVILARLKVPPEQVTITDTDKRKAETVISKAGRAGATRDLKIAGYPAFELLASWPPDTRRADTYVLVPGSGWLLRFTFVANNAYNNRTVFTEFKPAIDAAMNTLTHSMPQVGKAPGNESAPPSRPAIVSSRDEKPAATLSARSALPAPAAPRRDAGVKVPPQAALGPVCLIEPVMTDEMIRACRRGLR